MRCPGLSDLPPPPSSKTGWPWSVESQRLPETLPGGKPWPKVSIVTASYNQSMFIEETIRSVLLQGYPNLEYMILDGGSTDGSVDIIRTYEGHLEYWISQKDAGQAAAIQTGFERSTGEVLGWLNSDDFLFPEALGAVGEFFMHNPECGWVVGDGVQIDAQGKIFRKDYALKPNHRSLLYRSMRGCLQPATFWRREPYICVGGINSSLVYSMDYDLFLRLARVSKVGKIRRVLATLRLHADCKSVHLGDVRIVENKQIRQSEGMFPRHRVLWLALVAFYRINNGIYRTFCLCKDALLYRNLGAISGKQHAEELKHIS